MEAGNVGKIFRMAGAAVLFAVLVRVVMLPANFFFLLSIIILWFSLEFMLTFLEYPSKTSKYLKKLPILLGAVLFYMAYRIFLGHLLGMPIITSIDSFSSTSGAGIVGYLQSGMTVHLIAELALLAPGLILTYKFLKGSTKTRNRIGALAVLASILVIWQIKQPEQAAQVGKFLQASSDSYATQIQKKAIDRNAIAEMIVARAINDIPGTAIEVGDLMRVRERETIQSGGELEIKVIPERDGVFKGEAIMVPYRKIKILDGIRGDEESGENGLQWKTVYGPKEFIGKGFSGGEYDDGSFRVATYKKNYCIGDKVIIVGKNSEAYASGRFRSPTHGKITVNIMYGEKGHGVYVRAPKNERFIVKTISKQ